MTTNSYGFILREAPQIISHYERAQQRGVPLRGGYANIAAKCATSTTDYIMDYRRQVPPGTVTRTFGSQCAGIVTLLTHTHNFASAAILTQQEADPHFCHVDAFNRLQQLVAATLETTGQGRIIFPDTGRSMGSTVRALRLEPPRFIPESDCIRIYEPVARARRPLLSVPGKAGSLRR